MRKSGACRTELHAREEESVYLNYRVLDSGFMVRV